MMWTCVVNTQRLVFSGGADILLWGLGLCGVRCEVEHNILEEGQECVLIQEIWTCLKTKQKIKDYSQVCQ